jgi:hypothetical protein
MIWKDAPANESVTLTRIYRILNEGMTTAKALDDQSELLAIDELLARRPALYNDATRYQKIEHAIQAARKT